MEGIYLSVQLDDTRTLYVAPLSNRNIDLSGQEIVDSSGYFLYEKTGVGKAEGVEIIAHLLSENAAIRIGRMFNMS